LIDILQIVLRPIGFSFSTHEKYFRYARKMPEVSTLFSAYPPLSIAPVSVPPATIYRYFSTLSSAISQSNRVSVSVSEEIHF
jgi:hypothetical protein